MAATVDREGKLKMPNRLSGLRVVLGPTTFGEPDPQPRRLLAEAGLEVVENPFKRRLTRDETVQILDPTIVGLIAGLEPLDRGVLAGSHLRVVSRCGSGMSNVDLVAASELGIRVRSTPDGPTSAVAELVVAAMLDLIRGVSAMNAAMHAGKWPKTIGGQLDGKTIAIVGLGRIGRRLASLVTAFGARVVAVDPALTGSAVDGVSISTLADALRVADVVSLHCSGEAEVLGERELAAMKAGSYVLNCARGGVVNEAALKCALDSGHLAGAWLDTFVKEPYAGPLQGHPRVLLTPHVGSYTRECRLRMEAEAAQNLIDELVKLSTQS